MRKRKRQTNNLERIREDAKANGFELYDTGGDMGLGLRTHRRISSKTLFPYTGHVIELDVDSETGEYVGYPKDTSYAADLTTADGRPCLVDAFDLSVRNFTAYANHNRKYANADLFVTDDDKLVMQMKHDTPAGVPVYLDYGRNYVDGRQEYVRLPTDIWETPNADNGHRWVPPRNIDIIDLTTPRVIDLTTIRVIDPNSTYYL